MQAIASAVPRGHRPDSANFPNGVTYQRNANFNTHILFGLNNVTPILVSIDPFFFKIAPLQP
jgi:hypothetical protein